MRLFCPNLSDSDYQKLVDLHGEVRAAAIYARYNVDGVVPQLYYEQGVILKADSSAIRNDFGSEKGFTQAVDVLSTAFVSGMGGHTDNKQGMLIRAKELLGKTDQPGGLIYDAIIELRDYISEYDPETSQEYVNPLLNINVATLSEEELDITYTALDSIIENWNDVLIDQDNPETETIRKGFRSSLIDAIKAYGYNIGKAYTPEQIVKEDLELTDAEQDQNPDEEEEPSEADVEDDVVMAEKNYSIATLQVDPATTVSQEVKRLLQDIISPYPNMYGFKTTIPVTRLMGKIKSKVKNVTSFEQMQEALTAASKYDAELLPVVEALSRFSTAQKAQFFKTFRLDETKLIIIEESYAQEDVVDAEGDVVIKDGKAEKALGKSTTVIGINKEDSISKLRSAWLQNIQSEQQFKNNPTVYTVTKDEEGNNIYNLRNPISKTEDIKRDFSILQGTNLTAKTQALGRIMWELGMNIGNSKEENQQIIEEYILSKGPEAQQFLARVLDKGDIKGILQDIFETKLSGGRISEFVAPKKDMKSDYSMGRINQINYLANVFADLYTSDTVDSVLNGKGKPVYPVNKPTPLTDRINDMNSETRSQTYLDMEQDASLNPSLEHRSLLFGILESAEFGYFNIQTQQFSAVRGEEDEASDAKEYKDLKERGLLKTALDLFLMDGTSTMRVQVPTQESRENLTYVTLPKFDDFSNKSKLTEIFKDTGMSKRKIIEAIIVQDLVRINRDSKINEDSKESPQGGFKEYHDNIDRIKQMRLSGTGDVTINGTNLSGFILGMLEAGRVSTYDSQWNAIDQMVEKYLNETLPAHSAAMMQKLESLNLNETYIDSEGLKRGYRGDFNAFIDSFVFNTIVSRIELTSLFRGSHAYFKSIEDLYKRWGLLNTPGSRAFIKGSDPLNPDFGMFETFGQASFNDLGTEGEVTEKLANVYKDQLIKQGVSQERASAISNNFRSNVAKGTDALAIISPEMFRALIQGGFGPSTWTAENEEMYQRYREGGKWEFEFTPQFKLFYDHTGIVEVAGQKIYASELDKNAFFVLNRDVAATSPIMEDMYRAMNGEYTNGEPIHLFNAISAKKGIKRKVFTIDRSKEERGESNYFQGIEPTIQYGRSFVEPQVMSTKEKSQVRFNRQIRKHAVANINRQGTYKFRGTDISGQQLFDIYGRAFKAKVTKTLKDTIEEVGFRDYINATTEAERQTAKLKMLSKIKELTIESKRNSGQLDIVLEDQLAIVKVNNEYDFRLPVSFPTTERDLTAQFLGLFRSRVAKIMVPGVELVQAGAMGKFHINGELRELQFIDAASEDKLYVEVALSEDVLEKLGIKIGEDLDLSDPAIQEKLVLLGYRIPHQSLASTLVLRPAIALPKSYKKSIIVPANFTVVTGSDFDWDKLYVIMQDIDADGNIAFPNINITDLANQPLEYYESLDEAQLNNLLFYTQVAVSQNLEHLEEVLSGVESKEYKEIADRLNIMENADLGSNAFDDPLLDIKMYNKFMTAAGLVGQYANADSGFSVAVHGNLGDGTKGLRLNQSAKVTWVQDGVRFELDTVRNRSAVTGERVNKVFTSHGSASLDVGGQENPLQERTNDTGLTANATIHLGSVGVPEAGVIAFRMQPLVKEFTRRVNTSAEGPYQVFKDMIKELGLHRDLLQNANDRVNGPMDPMSQEDLETVIANQDTTSELAKSLFRNFIISYYSGKELRKIYKSLSPDTLDAVNDLGEMQVIADTINVIKAQSNPLVSAEDLQQFLEGDAFLPTQAFQEYFNVVFNAAKPLFFGPSDSVLMFKEYLKNILMLEDLTASQHRAINRALLYSLMSAPGTKFNELFLSKNPEGQFTGNDPKKLVDNKIWSRSILGQLNDAIKKYPALLGNALIDSLDNTSTKSPESRIVKLEFKPKGRVDADLSNRISEGFMLLISNPGRYTSPLQDKVEREKQNLEIAELGYSLMQYALISSAFLPSKSSFYKFIRPEMFEALGILNEFRDSINNSRNDINKFTDPEFVVEFVRNFGLSFGLIQKESRLKLTKNTKVYEGTEYKIYSIPSVVTETAMFYKKYKKVPKNRKGTMDATELYVRIGGDNNNSYYIKVTPKGIKNRLVEMNIPGNGGTIVTGREGMQKFSGELYNQFKSYLEQSAISKIYSSDNDGLNKYGVNCRF